MKLPAPPPCPLSLALLRVPALLRYGRDRFAGCAVAPSAGSLTPSGVRLKAPAAPGLFRGDREITVKWSKCQRWGNPPQARGWACGSRHKFPHRLFFCGCRLSAAAAESHPTDDGKIHRTRHVKVAQQPDGKIHQPFKTLFSWTRPQG